MSICCDPLSTDSFHDTKSTHRLLDLVTHGVKDDRKIPSQDERRESDQEQTEDEQRDSEEATQNRSRNKFAVADERFLSVRQARRRSSHSPNLENGFIRDDRQFEPPGHRALAYSCDGCAVRRQYLSSTLDMFTH